MMDVIYVSALSKFTLSTFSITMEEAKLLKLPKLDVSCRRTFAPPPNRDSCGGAWESIQIVTNDDGTVSLRSAANGKYVCVIADEKNQLVPRSENIGTWEKFIIERINHNEYALYSLANGKYVQANINDGGKLYADSETVAGAWEAFKITKIE